jgi:hypothetical protein
LLSEADLKVVRAVRRSLPVTALARRYYALRARSVKELIFTATTGRSGTLTLARIFAGIPHCRAAHEALPIMNAEALRAASYGDRDALERFYRMKAIGILRAAAGYRYYLEANHLFIKTFIAHAARDFGNRLAVIHLVRPPVDVAMSIYCLQDGPGTEIGNCWWLDYRAPLNRICIADLLDGGEFSHPFYKGLWYWFEIEARVAEWRRRLPLVPFFRFETGWLNDAERLFELTRALGVVVNRSQIDSLAGMKAHGRDHQKMIAPLPSDEAHGMLSRFVALLQQRYPAIAAETRTTVTV